MSGQLSNQCPFQTCRAGWQHHPVSSMRYHFVVPAAAGPLSVADSASLAGLVERGSALAASAAAASSAAAAAAAAAAIVPVNKPHQSAAAAIHARDLAARAATADQEKAAAAAAVAKKASGNAAGDATAAIKAETATELPLATGLLQLALPTEEALESPDRAGKQFSTPPSIYDGRGHLLHGVLHQNGFGHLLRVNGAGFWRPSADALPLAERLFLLAVRCCPVAPSSRSASRSHLVCIRCRAGGRGG